MSLPVRSETRKQSELIDENRKGLRRTRDLVKELKHPIRWFIMKIFICSPKNLLSGSKKHRWEAMIPEEVSMSGRRRLLLAELLLRKNVDRSAQ